jgi:hypothetical protein
MLLLQGLQTRQHFTLVLSPPEPQPDACMYMNTALSKKPFNSLVTADLQLLPSDQLNTAEIFVL